MVNRIGVSAKQAHPRSLAEAAWRSIKQQILSGELVSGSPVRIKEQAELLGMSMMPVREAVKKLQQEGLVVQESHKEPIVAELTVEDMEDVYGVRITLETRAVELACHHMDESTYQNLCELLDHFEQAYEAGDLESGREFHRQFHIELSVAANSPTLNRLIPPLLDSSERYRELSVPRRGPVKERRLEHQKILEACYSKNVEEAKRLITEHLSKTVELVRQSLEK